MSGRSNHTTEKQQCCPSESKGANIRYTNLKYKQQLLPIRPNSSYFPDQTAVTSHKTMLDVFEF